MQKGINQRGHKRVGRSSTHLAGLRTGADAFFHATVQRIGWQLDSRLRMGAKAGLHATGLHGDHANAK